MLPVHVCLCAELPGLSDNALATGTTDLYVGIPTAACFGLVDVTQMLRWVGRNMPLYDPETFMVGLKSREVVAGERMK